MQGYRRHFFSISAAFMVAVMIAGFYPYYLRGEGMAGRRIAPPLVALVFIHGGSLTGWLVLFFAQSVLVYRRKVRTHMRLGWYAAALALAGSVSGFALAGASARGMPESPFWGMEYRQFLLVMLTEMALFTGFVVAGVALRRKPVAHKAMMLMASLSILAGATVRMPVLFPVFGEAGWVGIFGPIFTLGALFVIVRSVLGGAVDRWLAGSYAVMVVIYIAACQFAVSDAWKGAAQTLLSR